MTYFIKDFIVKKPINYSETADFVFNGIQNSKQFKRYTNADLKISLYVCVYI